MEKVMNENSFKSSLIFSILKGVCFSICLTLFLFMILGVCLANSNLSEGIIKPAIIVISGVSILSGTSIGIRKQENKGIFKGAMIGFLYVFSLYMISSVLLGDFGLNIYSVIMFIVSCACGGVGGIIGVNLK
ncbi:MAG: TIGR04086 family membrane protein [Clostridia bacterium]|nr:TIGR04086 family membrane protein [Clostridia bacterium]